MNNRKGKISFNIRMFIGRLERCPECNKLILNRQESLSIDLYMGQKNALCCKKCSDKMFLH